MAINGEKKGKWSSEAVLDLYSKLLTEIWETVSALIGESILEFLFKLAIQKLKGKHSFLLTLKISEEGISWDGLRGTCQGKPPIEIHRGFQSLVTHLFDLFAALTEGVISRELFPKVLPRVREAERMIARR
jgi:hypothetical protein